ncbi:hypothetical protein MK559_05290 [Streptococcus gallolyticus subsp. gallolyticus]|uniref:hypothetical protein n=1 Tax=Streptococcus gallolyticus TaxID=315405 RepID=UPI0022832EF7|nr:hypothetical protein [Streptococcus gallolyticus]MCY7178403.1 hypothetical protein [Streptococcus gallolyticus subsp. gallolyticus]
MFQVTNTQTDKVLTIADRDGLLSYVNDQSVWAKDRKDTFNLEIHHVTSDGEILENKHVQLPLSGYVEEALAGFGLKKEKKRFSFGRKTSSQKPSNKQEGTKTDKQDLKMATSAPQKAEKVKNGNRKKVRRSVSIFNLFGIVFTFIFILTGICAFNYETTRLQLANIEQRLTLQEGASKIEVVGRYFIATYYSGDSSRLADYLSKDLKAEGVTVRENETLQSTMFESISQVKETFKITFVVQEATSDGTKKTVRLTLVFKEDKQSTYGYVLVRQPKYSSFTD